MLATSRARQPTAEAEGCGAVGSASQPYESPQSGLKLGGDSLGGSRLIEVRAGPMGDDAATAATTKTDGSRRSDGGAVVYRGGVGEVDNRRFGNA